MIKGGESCSPGFERRRITSNDISKGDSADQSLFYNFTKANYLIAFNTKNFNADCNGGNIESVFFFFFLKGPSLLFIYFLTGIAGRVVVIAPGLIIT